MKADPEHDTSNIKISQVKIADIAFAFNNAELIKLLKTRGYYIKYQNFDKMRETEKKISILKDEKFRDLTKPVEAFITFEEEDGSIVGQTYEAEYTFSGKRLPAKTKFMGQEFFLRESTEPTNIIWENMHFTSTEYIKRQALVFTAVALIVIISFSFMFWIKQFTI